MKSRARLLPFIVILIGLSVSPAFAGWTFTFTLFARGDCGGINPNSILPPQTPPPFMSTKSECDSLRARIQAITASAGGCTVGYDVTPCVG